MQLTTMLFFKFISSITYPRVLLSIGRLAFLGISLFEVCDRSFALGVEKKRGFLPKVYVDEKGIEHRYLVFIPHDYRPGDRRPVLLSLNGVGENGNDGLRQIIANPGPQIWDRHNSLPFIMVFPQCRENGSWFAGSLDPVWAMAILDEVVEEYGADPDRVCLTGISSGGSGAWDMASTYPERFAAVVPLCGIGFDGSIHTLVKSQIPIWNFYNEGDDAGLVKSNRDFRAKLIKSGASPLVTEYHQDEHNCWDRAYRDPRLYSWLLEQSRNNDVASHKRPFRFISTQKILSDWKVIGSSKWSLEKNDVLFGKQTAKKGMSCICSSQEFRDLDFHVDVRFDPKKSCDIGLLTNDISDSQEGCLLTVRFPETGAGGVSRIDGPHLAIISANAQRALDSKGWNDLRLRIHQGRLTLQINGRKAIDLPQLLLPSESYRIALYAPAEETKTLWRYVRIREN